ncbi:Probable crotonobetaine/carnitine-CoA ligase [Shewanella piezotolerans WP3]|uniref:Probable crotonobetaine/carnitine-CoA ligase n=1 Tax=Shewanella piezotolerans (strain WP3 / JCM 13877) TaxID=225849 RepID=B8CV77_SHEPW|nr:crotonobetaine/carnitine-CoA ligase [Shewanella piezotolerans]ACJ31553.1 Probable crotonobetaine/carnitine-CoA ligase [Shewanella piezotolerans WP3]
MDIVGSKTLRCMWEERARKFSNNTALVYEDAAGDAQEFTYSQLNDEITKTANLFFSLGVKKGDKVAVQLYNSPQFIFCWFGLAKIGAVTVPINSQYLLAECQYIIDKCAVTAVVIEEEFLPIYSAMQQVAGNSIKHILVSRAQSETLSPAMSFDQLLQQQAVELTQRITLSSDDVAEILFTSGTTSQPKGVEITHCNLQFAGYYTAWQTSLRCDDIYLTMMPSFHIDFQCNAAMAAFTVGATLVMLEKYSARKFWRQICDYRATITHSMPMIIRTLMLQPKVATEQNHCLRDMLFFLHISDQEKRDFESRFKVQLFNSYGMTETLVGLIGDSPSEERHWPSIGRPGLGYEAKVADENGQELAANVIGDLWVKGVPGRTIMKGYYQDAKSTEEVLSADGWLYTGDKAYVDDLGLFYFVDRKTNMIKRSGENISSTEIEKILMSHPYIQDAAVIGVADVIRDEAVKAFVILTEGTVLSVDEILQFCAENMAKFKVPSFIEIKISFPRTCTCKVQKKLLK